MSDAEDFVYVDSDVDTEEESDDLGTPQLIHELKTWLAPTEYDNDGSEYVKHRFSHMKGTGQWVSETDQYRQWHESNEHGCLWINGMPGSGKSVVAARLASDLAKDRDAVVLFFFFRYIILTNRAPHDLVRDWMAQLLPRSLPLQAKLKSLKKKRDDIKSVSYEELFKAFEASLNPFSKVYCIADALDEMETGNEKFIRQLLMLGFRKPESIKVIITSRLLARVQNHLRDPAPLGIRLDQPFVNKDIAFYATKRLQASRIEIDDKESIKDATCRKSNGLFLYARLMLDDILDSHDQDSAQEKLKKLPETLADMYTSILSEHSRRSKVPQSIQVLILQWVTHSTRPLRLIELGSVIKSLPEFVGLEAKDAKAMVRIACGPLLEILEDETVQVLHHSFTEFLLAVEAETRFISVGPDRFQAIDSSKAHRRLAEICIKYLMNECFKSWEIPTKEIYDRLNPTKRRHTKELLEFPLIQYAGSNWPLHVMKCAHLDPALIALLDEFLSPEKHEFHAWKDFYWPSFKRATEAFSILHTAAALGLTMYVAHLLEDSIDVNTVDKTGNTALFYAASAGHASCVSLLIARGAKPDIEGEGGWNPLQKAAMSNHHGVVRVLLEAGVDPQGPKKRENPNNWGRNSPPNQRHSPLQLAINNCHTKTVAELLKFVEPEELLNGPLHWAAERGNAQIVSLLLRTGQIDVHRRDSPAQNTPLYMAVGSHDVETVKLLLDNGADVLQNSLDDGQWGPMWNRGPPFAGMRKKVIKYQSTVLHSWAAGKQRNLSSMDVKTMQIIAMVLIAAGCDVNARDRVGKTPLHYIVPHHGYKIDIHAVEELTLFLLKHNADPAAIDNQGNTALHVMSTLQEGAQLIDLMVRSGADLEAVNNLGEVPLACAVRNQMTTVMSNMRKLLDLGADPNFKDRHGTSGFHLAFADSYNADAKLKMLIEAGGDPKATNHLGETCLFSLDRQRYVGIDNLISLMIDAGLDIDAKNNCGQTAMLSYAGRGNIDMTLKFIEHGANIHAIDHEGKNVMLTLASVETYTTVPRPLWRKATEGNLTVFQEFANLGADVLAVDFAGNNMLHQLFKVHRPGYGMIRDGRVTRSQLIQRLGIPANARNNHGQTVLHLIARQPVPTPCPESRERVRKSFAEFLDSSSRIPIDCIDNKGRTAMHLAAVRSEYRVATLLEKGANPHCLSFDRKSPLHYAAAAGQSNIVGLLVDIYLKSSWSVDQPDMDGCTPLHAAARFGRPESVKYLLEIGGANPTLKSINGRTALHACAEFKDPKQADLPMHITYGGLLRRPMQSEKDTCNIREVIRLLLSYGSPLVEFDMSENTAYDLAIALECEEMVDELSPLMNKADAELAQDSAISSVKAMAPVREQWMLLRSRNVQSIINTLRVQTDYTHSLLPDALSLNSEALVSQIVDAGVDFSKRGIYQLQSQLEMLVRWGFLSIVERLGHQVRAADLDPEESLLHSAAERELLNIDMIKLLVCFGLDIDKRRLTPPRGPNGRETYSVPGPSTLHILARGNYWWQAKALDYMIEMGADIEIQNENNETALQVAMKGGSSVGFWKDDTVAVLLKHKANANFVNLQGLTPLNQAAEQGEGPVRTLLSQGADMSLGKRPAIFDAILFSQVGAVEAFLEAGMDPNAPDLLKGPRRGYANTCGCPDSGYHKYPLVAAYCQNNSDSTHLHWDKVKKISRLLVKYGADVNLTVDDCDNGQTTILHHIARNGHSLEPFLEKGVELERRDAHGRTPLLLALNSKRRIHLSHPPPTREDDDDPTITTTVEELIQAGADIFAVDASGDSVLHHLMSSHHSNWEPFHRVFEMLLQKGVSINAKNNSGSTPFLTYLQDAGYGGCTERLISAGSDLLAVDNDGNSAFHFLARYLHGTGGERYTKFMRAFIDAGVSPNARNAMGNTPLFNFILVTAPTKWGNDSQMVGAPPYEHDSYGDDPPEYGTDLYGRSLRPWKICQHREKIHVLIDAGCDVHVTNYNGESLLHYAARMESVNGGLGLDGVKSETADTFQLLMEMGLDPRLEDVTGKTPLDVAAACGNRDILRLFEREE